MQYTVSNPGSDDEEGQQQAASVLIKVSGMPCSGDCSAIKRIDAGASVTFTANLTAPNVAPGDSKSITVQVTATNNGETNSTDQTVTVNGPAKPQFVTKVSGKVKDGDGKKLAGVTVAMQDGAGNKYDTSTSSSGGYSFTASDSKPIEVGAITVGALKEGFTGTTVTVQGSAGRSVNVPITLKKIAVESPSPSPKPSVSASAVPTEEVTGEPTDAASEANAGAVDTTQAADTSDGGINWLLIVMGVLLVAAGIGAMILVIMRRKNAAGDDLDGTSIGAGAGPPGPDRYSPGGGRGADATMIAPAAAMGMGGGISDAPTMIHRPVVEDEFPDPYGVPVPPQGGYHGTNQWGAAEQLPADPYGAGGYDAAPQPPPYGQQPNYGATQAGSAGYDSPAAPQQRYDEHTSLYQPESHQPPQPQPRYDEHTSLYQPEPDAGYGAGGYGAGQPPAPQHGAEGYDQQQAGYGDQAGYGGGYPDQGGYGQQQQPGAYGQQAGYDQQQPGYGQQGGYGGGYPDQGGYGDQQPPPPAASGYDEQPGAYGRPAGYDQRGSYGNPPPQQPGQRPKREWTDD